LTNAPDTEALAHAMIACTLPKAEWTHEAHLRVGLWHVLSFPEATALDLLRERIRAYNLAIGGINNDSGGYHETLTAFYVRLIRAFADAAGAQRPLEELAQELIARHGARDLCS